MSRTLQDSPILPWRIVAGGFLHFVLPAYLIALLVDFVVKLPTSGAAWLAGLLPFTGQFLLVYLALATSCALAAGLADPLLRGRRSRRIARAPRDEAQLSRRRLVAAIAQGRTGLGVEAATLLRAMETGRWDHDNPQFQALARDLDEVVRTGTAALHTAPPDRRAAIAQSTVSALRRLDDARRELETEAALRDEEQQLTTARYVELRYGSDFASKRD